MEDPLSFIAENALDAVSSAAETVSDVVKPAAEAAVGAAAGFVTESLPRAVSAAAEVLSPVLSDVASELVSDFIAGAFTGSGSRQTPSKTPSKTSSKTSSKTDRQTVPDRIPAAVHRPGVWDVLVVGAGPAGLFAALGAAGIATGKSGEAPKGVAPRVLVLEKMPTPGRKLLISGSGRCNVTHAGPISDFFARYGKRERFVKPALLNFTNENLVQFLKAHGLPCVRLNDGKIFPKTERARDVLNLLLEACQTRNVRLECGQPVLSARWNPDESVFEVRTGSGETFRSLKLILTVGGKSYPTTGSTGDGALFARAFGHTLVPLKPALTSVTITRYPFGSCAGIALPNALLSLHRGGQLIASHRGDVLFTHQGLSGPGILDFSRLFEPNDELRLASVCALKDEFLTDLLQRNSQREIGNLLRTEFQLSDRFVSELLRNRQIPDSLRAWQVTRPQRLAILGLLTSFPLTIQSLGGFREAMVTSGGIELSEVNRQTMESRRVPGLFFAGEVLDVDGDSGGFNLQFAFSSGLVAGQNAVKTISRASL